MRALRFFCIASSFVLTALEVCAQETHDLNEGLQSWSHMKRAAGYYTESGVYRGGLWRAARKTKSKVYYCLEDASRHCLYWTMQEENGRKTEYDNCTCAATELPYCNHWECTTTDVDKNPDCTVDRDSGACTSVGDDTLKCACNSRAPNQRYCSEWSCHEDSSKSNPKNEDYQCLEEDVTGEYCYRWNGNISSSFKIESSVCECFERKELFCKYWECRERSLIRCAAHTGGWCSLELGIGVGGGCGLIFLITFGVVLSPSYLFINNSWWCTKIVIRLVVVLIIWVSVGAALPVIIVSLTPTCREYFGQFFGFLFLTLLFVCPWLIGVAIWGGTLAVVIVVSIWVAVFTFISFVLYYEKLSENRRVHPSSQV